MLRVSKLADYATVVMVFFARQNQAFHNAKEIASHNHLTLPTVSKILKKLASHGLLSSVQGAKGGYSLARSSRDISVAQIIAAVEGTSGLTECSHTNGDCSLESVCSIRGNWQLINDAVQAALNSVTLAQLAKPTMSITSVNVRNIKRIGKPAPAAKRK